MPKASSLAFLWLLLSSLSSCGVKHEHVIINRSPMIATDAHPLNLFTVPNYALSQASRKECQGLQSFFEDYASFFMPEVQSSVTCTPLPDTLYTSEEMVELGYAQAYCASGWQCYKARWELRKDSEKDVFYALVIRFDDGETLGFLSAARRNRSLLPPASKDSVPSAQLIDPGLAGLPRTFYNWVNVP